MFVITEIFSSKDVIYHNEAYSRSNSSVESSPVSSKQSLKECTPSPKSGSFVSAVIGAIRNAATHPFAAKNIDKKSNSDLSKQIYKGKVLKRCLTAVLIIINRLYTE